MNKKYDLVIIDPHTRLPDESLGHSIGLETAIFCSSEKGLSVLLVTSSFSHMMKKQRVVNKLQRLYGYQFDLLTIPVNSYYKHMGLMRLLWHIIFTFGLLINLRKFRSCKVLSISSPIPFVDICSPILKFFTGAYLVVQIRDLWPEHFYSMPLFQKVSYFKVLLKPLSFMRRRLILSSNATISVSEKTRSVAIKNSTHKNNFVIPNITVSKNDFVKPSIHPRSEFANKNEIIINYSGTLGEGYDIENLITAVDKFNKKNRNIVNLKFIISGDGPKKQKIKKIISNLNSDYIQFMGALSKPQYLSLLQHSSLGILPYIAQSAVDFPAKCYDYIIAGTPMLHSLDGELKVFCKENKCGFYYEPGNVSSLVECLDYLFIKDKINMISSNTSSLSDSYGKETQLENFFKVYTKKYLE